jgi:hypothetical protein
MHDEDAAVELISARPRAPKVVQLPEQEPIVEHMIEQSASLSPLVLQCTAPKL